MFGIKDYANADVPAHCPTPDSDGVAGPALEPGPVPVEAQDLTPGDAVKPAPEAVDEPWWATQYHRDDAVGNLEPLCRSCHAKRGTRC